MNTLSLVEMSDGNAGSVAVLDFIVDGISLRESLKTPDLGVLRGSHAGDFPLQFLTGDGALDGRVAILYCRECSILDVWDGGYAVRVIVSEHVVRWGVIERFYATTDDTGEILILEPTALGPFEFEPTAYRTLFEGLFPSS